MYTVKEYNDLNLKNINHFSLILFISSISENLGHFATIFKGKDNKVFFCDSYGKKLSFYKQNINNKYVKINFFLKFKLQSNISTICGGYSIFFVHTISLCEYDAICFTKLFLKVFN